MRARRILSIAVIGSLTVFSLPGAARADEVSPAAAAVVAGDTFYPVEDAPPTLRGSIDRAASKAVRGSQQRRFAAALGSQNRLQSPNGGGGGGGTMAVMMILGTVASLAATYYIMKQMREQTEQTQTTLIRR